MLGYYKCIVSKLDDTCIGMMNYLNNWRKV